MNQLTNQRVRDASPAKKGDRRSPRLIVKEIQKIRKKIPGKKLNGSDYLLRIRRGQLNRSVLYALLWQMFFFSSFFLCFFFPFSFSSFSPSPSLFSSFFCLCVLLCVLLCHLDQIQSSRTMKIRLAFLFLKS